MIEAVRRPPAFTQGSIMRHVLVMTGSGAVGLLAIFFVDFLSLLYISWLGDPHLTAAVGYATQIMFIATSVNIGMLIAVSALCARALGAGDRPRARRLAASSLTHVALISSLVALLILLLRRELLGFLGATGGTADVAARFLVIVTPSNVLLALGMAFSGVLRAVGDARRAMMVTLSGGLVTAALDPLLIFGAGLGVDGAASAIVVARAIFFVVGWRGAVVRHRLVERPTLEATRADAGVVAKIALPAILTNIATPVGASYVVSVFSQFGEGAIAATAIIDRVTAVCFGAVFALSGAIGPIIGQNVGARLMPRVRRTLADACLLTTVYALAVWLALYLGGPWLVRFFNAGGETARLVLYFCAVGAAAWLFLSMLFVANAAFNNLDFPLLSTLFNWGRATLGTIPFVTLGAKWGGPEGAMLGIVFGGMIFGLLALATAFFLVRRLEIPRVPA